VKSRTMFVFLALMILAAMATLSLEAPSPALAAKRHLCGTRAVDITRGRQRVVFIRRRRALGCARVRRVLRRLLQAGSCQTHTCTEASPVGWRCRATNGPNEQRTRRLATCSRRNAAIAAYDPPGTHPWYPRVREARSFHRCGHVGSSAGWGYGSIRAYSLSCHEARLVILALHLPDGWTFRYHGRRDWWQNGRKLITARGLGD
jgi:hypothetical protein